MLGSEELSEFLNERMVRGAGHIVFVIGGSLGLSPEVLDRADYNDFSSPDDEGHTAGTVLPCR